MTDDLYDELTRRRIDGVRAAPHPAAGSGRRVLGGGALLTAVALGLRDDFEPRRVDPIVEEVDGDDDIDVQAVSLHLPWGLPGRSRALVRSWLLAR